VSTNRLEAFSDGVFAIAITLLVLELVVPTGDDLWRELKDEWPSFGAFAVSFWVIGIIWIYALAIGISFVSPAVVLVIIALLALYYAVAGMRSPAADG
jgi:uncharacterized membrane protein